MVVALSRKERVYTRDSDNGRIDGAGDDDSDEEQALKRVAFDSEDSDFSDSDNGGRRNGAS